MNLVYSRKPRVQPKTFKSEPPTTSTPEVRPPRVSLASGSMFNRMVKPEGGCGCGGGH